MMPKILIIEDEKAMGNLISLKFKVEGFEVDQVGSFKEAKEMLIKNSPYNAILTDYLLPDGDLADFLTSLKSDPSHGKVPVLVMTNYIEDLNIEKLKSQGVVDVIVKYQIVPAQMVQKVKQVISGGNT